MVRPFLIPLLGLVLTAGTAFAQIDKAAGTAEEVAPLPKVFTLKKGEKVEGTRSAPVGGGQSASVSSTATGSGGLKITYTGTKTENPRGSGCFEVGEITKVTNPASGGTNGPIVIDNVPDVDLDKSAAGGGSTTISGNGVTVDVDGNGNNVSVGGSNTTVNVNGDNNNITCQPGSSGTINDGGDRTSITVQPGSGGWTINRT